MNTFTLYLSSLILALVLPISILAMYLMLAHKTQLASTSAMNAAVVQRFDSEAARAGWHYAGSVGGESGVSLTARRGGRGGVWCVVCG